VTESCGPDLTGLAPSRILAVQLRRIGDVLLTTPAVELLKRRFPEAELHVLTEKTCAPVLENNPHVDQLWVLDRAEHKDLRKALAFYLAIRRTGFDLVVDFQQLPRCRYAVLASRAATRLSFPPRRGLRWLYTHWAQPLEGYAAMAKASILRPLGIHWNFDPPRVYLTDEERRRARDVLAGLGVQSGDELVTLDPSHRRHTRRWPAERFAETARLVLDARPRAKFLLLAGPGEQDLAREVQQLSGRPERMLLPEDILSLREMAGVIEAAALHLGNCSAPKHFAAAVDTPSVSVLGATSWAWTCPPAPGAPRLHENVAKNLPCQPCNRDECQYGERPPCLDELGARPVADRVVERLNDPAPGS
jgi:ADP-heptose:LPS heptosyltransferase